MSVHAHLSIVSLLGQVDTSSNFRDTDTSNDMSEFAPMLECISKECSVLCQRRLQTQPPPFRKLTIDSLEEFSWTIFSKELEWNCPVLYRLLMAIASHSDHRNTTKQGSFRLSALCMTIAILLKEHNREMLVCSL